MRSAQAAERAREAEPGRPPRRARLGPLFFVAAGVLTVGAALLSGDLLDLTWPVWPILLGGLVVFGIARRGRGRPAKVVAAGMRPLNAALAAVLLLELLFNLYNPQVKWLLAAENSVGYVWERCCAAPPALSVRAAVSLIRSGSALSEPEKRYYRELFRVLDAEVRYGAQAEVSRRLMPARTARSTSPRPGISRAGWRALESRFCQAIGGLSWEACGAGSNFFRGLVEAGAERAPAPESSGLSPREEVLRAQRQLHAEREAQRFGQQFHEMSEELEPQNSK